MSDVPATTSSSRQSSPRFPFISLAKALERAEALRSAANFGFAPVTEVRNIWGYGPKSSGGDQTVAALGYYGLIEEAGAGKDRKIKISELGARYLRDERPDVRRDLQTQMARSPKAMQTLWDLWQRDIPSDAIARSILKNDVGFSDSAATQVLSVYRDNLVYFPDTTSAKLHDPEAVVKEQEKNDDHTRKDKPVVNIGDWVQWAPNGVLKFANAKRVTWIDETADFVRVGGSMSALPLDEIELAERPKADAATEPTSGQWDVLLSGNRLQITADVDSAGLKKLKQVLDKYEEILALGS